mmetsp:Transcript_11666/g.21090  ORF Transcript_11666/g.21090 Transcript_11666/m.21090 type:complete len:218 (+) Transcript_11666:720-1373(+)
MPATVSTESAGLGLPVPGRAFSAEGSAVPPRALPTADSGASKVIFFLGARALDDRFRRSALTALSESTVTGGAAAAVPECGGRRGDVGRWGWGRGPAMEGVRRARSSRSFQIPSSSSLGSVASPAWGAALSFLLQRSLRRWRRWLLRGSASGSVKCEDAKSFVRALKAASTTGSAKWVRRGRAQSAAGIAALGLGGGDRDKPKAVEDADKDKQREKK